MNNLNEKQLKEIQEACLSSYRRGYQEGFADACKELRGVTEKLADMITNTTKEASAEESGEE